MSSGPQGRSGGTGPLPSDRAPALATSPGTARLPQAGQPRPEGLGPAVLASVPAWPLSTAASIALPREWAPAARLSPTAGGPGCHRLPECLSRWGCVCPARPGRRCAQGTDRSTGGGTSNPWSSCVPGCTQARQRPRGQPRSQPAGSQLSEGLQTLPPPRPPPPASLSPCPEACTAHGSEATGSCCRGRKCSPRGGRGESGGVGAPAHRSAVGCWEDSLSHRTPSPRHMTALLFVVIIIILI